MGGEVKPNETPPPTTPRKEASFYDDFYIRIVSSARHCPMSRWFRFYAEALDDPKVQKLDPTTFKHWVNLLCLTAKHDGILPSQDDIAFALRIDNIACQSLLDRLLIGGLIDVLKGGPNGSRIAPHGWDARQYKSDVSTERVKRFRERSKNVAVTPPDTDTESDTDTDILLSKESMSETPVSDPQGDSFNPRDVVEVWNEVAVKLGKPKVRDLTAERRQLLKARMAQYKLDDFVQVFNNIERSPFLRGDGGWRGCTFDWVFKKANFQKILEGNYND